MIFEDDKKSLQYEDDKRSSFVYDKKIICVIWKKGVIIELEDAKDTMKYALENYNLGKPMPTYVDMTEISGMSRESRDYFQNTNTGTSNALALVVASMLSRLIGNIFISMNQSGIPLKLFNEGEQAIEWLNTFT